MSPADRRHPAPTTPGGAVAQSAQREGRTSTIAEWDVIEAYLADFARELNDQAPLRASVARAVNLMIRSGLSPSAFLPCLFEARALTKDHADAIRTTVTVNGARRPVTAKMAYFFAILEDLLGLRPNKPT